MVSILDVNPNELIEKVAQELKHLEEIKPPKWAPFVKTGHFRQRPPVRSDWWYVRSAAVLRSVYKLGPIGVQKLRTKYGGKKDRGHKSEHFYKASGNLIRKMLQQLEKVGFIKHTQKGVHKGRVVTPKGRSFLAKVTKEIVTGKKVEKKIRTEKEVKEKKPKKEEVKPKEVKVKKEEKKKEVKEKKEKPKVEKKPKPEKPKRERKKEEKEDRKKIEELAERFKEKGTLREPPKEPKVKKKKKVEDVDLSKEKVEELAKKLKKKGTLRDKGGK